MKNWYSNLPYLIFLLAQLCLPAFSQQIASVPNTAETGANTLTVPKPILKTGVSLNTPGLSPNTLQLANTIGLTPIIEHIQVLRSQIKKTDNKPALENLNARQDLWDEKQNASLIIQRTNLDIEFTVAEIEAEHKLYQEILATFINDRDKLVARVNAASFISNGSLWAIAEALDVPTYSRPRYSVSSGTTGILAGIIPSIASMYTLKAVNGKKKTSEVEPNMLAKLFGYPTNAEIEYPDSVWQYLHQVPAGDTSGKTRLDQIIDRWVADANMTAFTDRQSKKQLDVLTASVSQRKGLSIGTLTARSIMLQQLHVEISKMKRMLLELIMAVQGEKQFVVDRSTKPYKTDMKEIR